MKRTILLAAIMVIGLIPAWLVAAGPSLVHYQARIHTAAGDPIEGDTLAVFRFYSSVSGDTVLWGETQTVHADKGLISVDLGEVNPFPENMFAKPELYLGIAVSTDPEMAPRRRLAGMWKTKSTAKVAGQTIQDGLGTFTVSSAASGSTVISFAQPFLAPPVVMVGAPHNSVGGIYFTPAVVSNVTTTGCTVSFNSINGAVSSGTASFDWMAIGE